MTEHPEGFSKVIYSGIQFLQAITATYGTSKGLEFWDSMVDTLGSEVKGAIFFAMMTGDVAPIIRFTGYNTDTVQKIHGIRLVRLYGVENLGLKESKDFIFDIVDYGKIKTLNVHPTLNLKHVIQEFTNYGFNVEVA